MNKPNMKLEDEFSETVVEIKRVSKKTKGGNQMRFTALVVVGDKKGKVSANLARGKDVRSAVQKALAKAKDSLVEVPLSGRTIPFEIRSKYNAARILLKPAPEGSGIIAGGPMRVVLEAAGVHDAVGKIMGTRSKASNVYATIKALREIGDIQRKKQILKNG
jgi:small subunit ribosomal protein S5